MKSKDPQATGSNPYAAPASDLSKDSRKSPAWGEFAKHCAGKVYRRYVVILVVLTGSYQFAASAILAVTEQRYLDVFFELIAHVVVFAICALLVALLVARIGVYYSCKKRTVTEFVQKHDLSPNSVGNPFVMTSVVLLFICSLDFIREYIRAFFGQGPVWFPDNSAEMLAAVPIAFIVAYPLLRATIRSHQEILESMSPSP